MRRAPAREEAVLICVPCADSLVPDLWFVIALHSHPKDGIVSARHLKDGVASARHLKDGVASARHLKDGVASARL
jgi:hypothetical protein